MTYTKLHNLRWSDEWTEDRWNSIAPKTKQAFQIIEVFKYSKGFDWWWLDIQQEDKDRIFDEIIKKL